MSYADLDQLLLAGLFATSPEANQEATMEAQKYIVEHAILIPLYASTYYNALSNRVHDTLFLQDKNTLYLFDAFIEPQ